MKTKSLNTVLNFWLLVDSILNKAFFMVNKYPNNILRLIDL